MKNQIFFFKVLILSNLVWNELYELKILKMRIKIETEEIKKMKNKRETEKRSVWERKRKKCMQLGNWISFVNGA